MTADPRKLFAAYSVRNVKTFTGMEGPGFSATLCRDGKPVASVLDEAVGACFLFHWKSDADESALRTLCAQVPHELFEGMSIAYDMDRLVLRLVNEYEIEKRLKRIAKTKTLFRIKGDAPDQWWTINAVGPGALQFLTTKYGEQLETVYGQAAADVQ
jgi:hypothetical protein